MRLLPTGQFTGWHMLGVMVLFFGTVIAVNLTLAFFANYSWTGLVVENSYVAGQTFNEESEKARKQATLGLTGKLVARTDAVEFDFTDPDGKPVIADKIEIRVGRPSFESEDHTLVLDYAGTGKYFSEAALTPGLWLADIKATLADGSDWRQHWRLNVPYPKGAGG
ncbi:MAG: FixH family protein [Salaquimonas sp.]|nr:FixH family protein [Salaquimonas sp.]